VKVWKFKRGIPTKWVGPSLNATQNAVAIESLEIGHEGLFLEVGA
jgi:phage tail-like protein